MADIGILGRKITLKRSEVSRIDPGGASISAIRGSTDYITDANCKGAWYMNGTSAENEIDRTSNGNDLTQGYAPTSSTDVPTGYVGKSRVFDGFAKYLSRNDADLVGLDISGATAKVSLVAWVRVNTVPGDTIIQSVIAKYNSSSNNRQYTMRVIGTGSSQFKFEFGVSANGTTLVLVDSTTTTYVGATWYHVGMVDNNTDLRIYVNGVLDCTPVSHTTGIFNGNSIFCIGSDSNARYVAANIDEVAVFDRELTSGEVVDIYGNGISGNKGASD